MQVLLISLLSLAAAPVQAPADGDARPLERTAPLRYTLTPGIWLPRMLGDTALGGASIKLDDQLSLRDQQSTFNLELEVHKEQWTIHASGYDVSVDAGGSFQSFATFGDVALSPGDLYRAEVGITSAGVEAAWQWPRYPENDRTTFGFGPAVAVRYVGVDQRIEEIGVASATADADWLGVGAGGRLDMSYRFIREAPVRRLEISAAATVGPALGGDGGWVAQIRASATLFVNDHLGLQLGFRLLHIDAENGPVDFNGGLQGFFVGASIRF